MSNGIKVRRRLRDLGAVGLGGGGPFPFVANSVEKFESRSFAEIRLNGSGCRCKSTTGTLD
jgi:hypothetical protein